ncbi:hypothetical protein [Malaciobacter molluscorum]|uniref:hypothetical protein n=1 Tax=Malaciobacter molluscorum TaxID=1032072 RepID=UPI001D1855EF|nr:hypothetical protein [Malaciobacter molluscorum]
MLFCIYKFDGKELLKCQEIYINTFHELSMKSMIIPFSHPRTWMYRAFCFMIGFANSRTDKEKNEQMSKVYKTMVKVVAKHGWGDYRAVPPFQDAVSGVYNFNNSILKRFTQELKDTKKYKNTIICISSCSNIFACKQLNRLY